jgi:Spy/CpxP family protein refolding chaperone
MKKVIFIASLVLLVATAGTADAGPGGYRGGTQDGFILDSLELSAVQMERVRGLKASYLQEKEPLRARLYTLRMQLKLLWLQTKADPVKIKAKQKEIHDLKWQLREKRTDYRLAFREILTPEQLSKYILLKQDRKHKKRKGQRGW